MCIFVKTKIKSMKHHEVELEDLQAWQQEKTIVFAWSTRENKSLNCTLRGSYEVYKDGIKVLETMQPFIAVEHYNSL